MPEENNTTSALINYIEEKYDKNTIDFCKYDLDDLIEVINCLLIISDEINNSLDEKDLIPIIDCYRLLLELDPNIYVGWFYRNIVKNSSLLFMVIEINYERYISFLDLENEAILTKCLINGYNESLNILSQKYPQYFSIEMQNNASDLLKESGYILPNKGVQKFNYSDKYDSYNSDDSE